MDIIISNADARPIYEQIARQITAMIMAGRLTEGEQLPSIRALASELHVSVITTKRAYADLEEQGFVETVPGKGCFVAGGNGELLREEALRGVEELLSQAILRARVAHVVPAELHEMIDVLWEDEA